TRHTVEIDEDRIALPHSAISGKSAANPGLTCLGVNKRPRTPGQSGEHMVPRGRFPKTLCTIAALRPLPPVRFRSCSAYLDVDRDGRPNAGPMDRKTRHFGRCV